MIGLIIIVMIALAVGVYMKALQTGIIIVVAAIALKLLFSFFETNSWQSFINFLQEHRKQVAIICGIIAIAIIAMLAKL